MLDLRVHAGLHVGKAVSSDAAAGRADASKVILLFVHVAAPSIAAAVLEIIGLEQHLEERVVPADAPGVAPVLIPAGDVAVARVEAGIAVFEKRHQLVGRYASGHRVCRAGSDRGCRVGGRGDSEARQHHGRTDAKRGGRGV